MKRKIVIISLILILISLIGYLVVYLIKDKQSKQQDIAKEILYSNYTDFVPAQSEEIVDTLGTKELSNPTLLYNGFTYVIPLPKSLDEVEINYMNNIYAKDGSFFIYLREGEQKNDLEDYKINNPLCNIISFYDKSNKVLLQIQCYNSEAYSFFKKLDYYNNIIINEFQARPLKWLKADKKAKFKFPKISDADKNGKYIDDMFVIETFNEAKPQLYFMFSLAQMGDKITNIYYSKDLMYVKSNNLLVMSKRKGHNDYIMTIQRR